MNKQLKETQEKIQAVISLTKMDDAAQMEVIEKNDQAIAALKEITAEASRIKELYKKA